MSTESESKEQLQSSDWTMSLRAEEDHMHEVLRYEARLAYDANGGLMYWDRVGAPHYPDPEEEEDIYDVAQWKKFGDELFPRAETFANSYDHDRVAMMRAWWGDAYWLYGATETPDGLFVGPKYRERFAFDKTSRLVLSGLMGDHLIRSRKPLRHEAEKLEMSPLDRAILVGSAALAMNDAPVRTHESGATYLGVRSEAYVAETWTGAQNHGDFRTSRRLRPLEHVTTTLNPSRVHPFMPIFHEEERSGAYHGTEPDIIGALLAHMVKRVGVDKHALHASLHQKLQERPILAGGNFGDFGVSEGDRQADLLRYRLEDERTWDEPEEQILRGIVDSQSEYLFTIVSTPNGVRFANGHEGRDPISTMNIPNEEIIEYLTTLIRGGGGRTSPRTMLQVIDALVEE